MYRDHVVHDFYTLVESNLLRLWTKFNIKYLVFHTCWCFTTNTCSHNKIYYGICALLSNLLSQWLPGTLWSVTGVTTMNNIRNTMLEIWTTLTLEVQHTWTWKCHFNEIFISGCTGSCHFDNFQCSQWWKFCENDISIWCMAMYLLPMSDA